MNHKIANLLKTYVDDLDWTDKIAGLVQTANIRVKSGDNITEKSYPVSCDIDVDACLKGAYQDLAPNSKKKSVVYFEDRGGADFIERIGNRMKFQSQLRLVCWLNLKEIQEEDCDSGVTGCGTSGDYVIDIIKVLPNIPISTVDFVNIYVSNISQVERSVDIFSRYSYNEEATQYLMFPYDYFALDLTIEFMIPCTYVATLPGIPVAVAAEDITDTSFTAKWGFVAKAEGYFLDVATDAGFASLLINNMDVGTVDEYSVSGLDIGVNTYYYRVRAYNDAGISGNSNTINLTTTVSDWFLPSKDALSGMYTQLKTFGVGNFQNAEYWSSTEEDQWTAWLRSFTAGVWRDALKDEFINILIRPCRSFTALAGAYVLRDVGPAGGRIFYVSGTTYLEAAPSDLADSAWSNITNLLVGTASGILTGQANTTAIIAQTGHVTSAAKLCDDLVI